MKQNLKLIGTGGTVYILAVLLQMALLNFANPMEVIKYSLCQITMLIVCYLLAKITV